MEQLTRYEQKQLKKKEREEGRIQERRKKQIFKWFLVLLAGGAIGTSIFFFFVIGKKSPKEETSDLSRQMEMEGETHVAEGTDVQYKSNPPTSGSHWPTPLKDGLYDTEKPDEAIIHSLEHGRVWISYKPAIPEETKQALKELLKGQSAIILSPRSANEQDIALASWGRQDTFNLNAQGSLDTERVLKFIQTFRNKGPEFVPAGAGGGKEY